MTAGTGTFTKTISLTPTVTTTYYWRVKAKDNHNAESDWSTTRSFTVNVAPPDLCPNITGNQATIPSGYEVNGSGDCVPITPPDLCPNLPGDQTTIPNGYIDDGSGNCVPVTPPDLCPNIGGNQGTIPNGYEVNGSGDCVPIPPIDVCPNLGGSQATVPAGYTKDGSGNCISTTPNPPNPPTDFCPNIDGLQATVPAGYTVNNSGDCVKNSTPPTDVCPNIDGNQTKIPNNYIKDSSGNCVPKKAENPTDFCPNINSNQTTVPAGYTVDGSGKCVPNDTPSTDSCPNIDGNQTKVPDGFIKDSSDNCVPAPIVDPRPNNQVNSIHNLELISGCKSNEITFSPIGTDRTAVIYRSTKSSSLGSKIAETTANQFMDEDIKAGNTYYYTVVLKNNITGDEAEKVSVSGSKNDCFPVIVDPKPPIIPEILGFLKVLPRPNDQVAAVSNKTSKATAIVVPAVLLLLPILQGLTSLLLNGAGFAQGNALISLIDLLLSPFRFLGFLPKKKQRAWGKVYNAITGLPIPNIVVRLVSQEFSKTVAQTQTDTFGEYNFVVTKTGTYFLSILAVAYEPQHTQTFSLNDIDGPPTDLNVNLTEISASRVSRLINKVRLVTLLNKILGFIRVPLLVAGSILALYNLLTFADITSLIITLLYISFWIIYLYLNHAPRNFGVIMNDANEPLSRSIVRLFKLDKNGKEQLTGTTVTDEKGRYKFSCQPGEYVIGVINVGYAEYKSDAFRCRRHKTPTLNIRMKTVQANSYSAPVFN